MPLDVKALREWVGKTETAEETIARFPVAALSATLDREDPLPRDGDPLPALWHWLFFLSLYRHSEAGPDGHQARGYFLPPVPLPRRMWAGSRFEFAQPLRVGDTVRRVSTLADVTHKTGRSGELVFVRVRHCLATAAGNAITEDQNIVYREAARPGDTAAQPVPAPEHAAWRRTIRPDPLLLFRYSALTFNGHRIHYDRPYCNDVEGYPGLVVHGPLLATLLLDLLRRERPDAVLARFEFRAIRPVFDIAEFSVCGAPQPGPREVRLWIRDADGALAMDGAAILA